MDAMNMRMTRNLFDDDVVQEIDKYHKSRGLCFALSGAGEGSGAGGSKASAASSSTSSAGREKISVTGYHTPEWAKAYLPKVSGCWIRRDVVRFMRWQTMYPTKAPPSHWGRSWGKEFSESEALIYVLT